MVDTAANNRVTNSLSRVRYFFGQLLTPRDLDAEQAYHLRLQRLTQREGFGVGTVSGLRVAEEFDGQHPLRSVFILPGLALDPDGRELLLERPVCVQVADEGLVPAGAEGVFAGNPATQEELAAAVGVRFAGDDAEFTEANLDELAERLTVAGLLSTADKEAYDGGSITRIRALLEQIPPPDPLPELEIGQTLVDYLYAELVGETFVGIQYGEAGSDPAPAVLDAACCGENACFASRTQEAVLVVTSPDAFPELPDPVAALTECLSSEEELTPEEVALRVCECLLDSWRDLPANVVECNTNFPTLCLARVFWSRFSLEGGQITAIDNCGCRQLAPGGPMLRFIGGGGGTGVGIPGPKGDPGPTGVPGPMGDMGVRGHTGDEGPQGPPGPQGPEGGPTGPQGPPGMAGATGSQGPQGAPGSGSMGQQGPQGPAGPQGASVAGPQGSPGPQGAPGAQGAQGAPGDPGPQGAPGSAGAQGAQGAAGAEGPQGSQGAVGAQGAQGAQGPQGAGGSGIVEKQIAVDTDQGLSADSTNNVFIPTVTPGRISSFTAVGGTYILFYSAEVGRGTSGNRIMARVINTASGTVLANMRRVQSFENVPDTGIPLDTNSSQMSTGGDLVNFSGSVFLTLTAGTTHQFEFQFANNNLTGATNVIRVRRQRLILLRVG